MCSDDPADYASEAPEDARETSLPADTFPWLLRQKIAIPDPVPGYVHLEAGGSGEPTRRRLTVLHASGGFGKTTLMAECCRRLRQDGVATAWISLDERDEPGTLDAYIAFACVSAGLNLLDVSNADKAPVGPGTRIGDQDPRNGDPTVVCTALVFGCLIDLGRGALWS